jgi:iron complex outermembrane receptor protein
VNYHDVDTHEAVTGTGYKKQRFEFSAFFAVRKSYNDRLNLNLMARQERIDNSFAPIIPFLGFDFRIIKGKDLLLKGNIARNYHHPSLNDLYWQPGGYPDLLPEEGISGELGLEYQKTYQGHLLKSEITAYRSDINNWIIWIPSYKGFWEPRNIIKVLTQGIEFKVSLDGKINRLKYKFAGNFAFTPSLNYGDPTVWGDLSYGKQLVYVPLQSNNVMVSLSYLGFFATYQFNHYGERYTTSSNDFTRRDWLYPYFMNDLIFGKDFHINNIHLSAEIKIYNLFNETYHSILYRPMPGRNYMFLLMFNI